MNDLDKMFSIGKRYGQLEELRNVRKVLAKNNFGYSNSENKNIRFVNQRIKELEL